MQLEQGFILHRCDGEFALRAIKAQPAALATGNQQCSDFALAQHFLSGPAHSRALLPAGCIAGNRDRFYRLKFAINGCPAATDVLIKQSLQS